MSDEELDVSLSRRSITFWMTLSRTGLDVELWSVRPDRLDFGEDWVTWSAELPDGGSAFLARWPVGRAQAVLGTIPDDDRQCLRFSSRYEGP